VSDEAQDSPLSISGSPERLAVLRCRHEAMACRWEIFICGERDEYARQAASAAFAEVDQLELELSRFVPHSDVARINTLRPGQVLRIGIDALECLELAAQVHRDTGGAFDVTIGALLAGRRAEGAPSPVGMDRLDIRRATRDVAVRAEGLAVDLGAVGKGYALDRAAAVLREWHIGSALLHCGQSTVYALGQGGWTVAVRNPVEHSRVLGQVSLRDAALSGSGVLLHGRHIIDPRTRQAAAGAVGAWAVAASAALSDAISTAFMVLSPAEVAEYCRRHSDVSGLLYVEREGGPALLRYGSAFASFGEAPG
jgi:thiamine biosynthesis lipoprotein